MCSISGFNFEDKVLSDKMNTILRHRGPDHSATFSEKGISLNYTRLSIVDVAGGNQPISNEEGNVWIVYNGEVYNYKVLGEQLGHGHKFRTATDTEVIVHLYETFGESCFDLLDGMFACAIWDGRINTLILARDRYGIKPLFYAFGKKGRFYFASEIKAILEAEDFEIDVESVNKNFILRFVPGSETFFKGIYKILPGKRVFYKDGTVTTKSYNEVVSKAKLFGSFKLQATYLSHLLSDTMSDMYPSEVPWGIYLSGGIDSSFITAIARRSFEEVNTFSMSFEGDKTTDVSARLASETLRTNHKFFHIDDLFRDYPKMIWNADAPKRNLWPYHLAKYTSAYVKVVFNGLGADELFGGYTWRTYALSRYAGDANNPRQKAIEYLKTHGRDFGDKFSDNEFNAVEYFTHYFSNSDTVLQQASRADFENKMTFDLLHVEDASSMAHSLEVRLPYLRDSIVSLAQNLPDEWKYTPNGKYILRESAKSLFIPKVLTEKEKVGFNPLPSFYWENGLRERYRKYLIDGIAVKMGLIQKKIMLEFAISNRLSDILANRAWSYLALELFLRLYFTKTMKPDERI